MEDEYSQAAAGSILKLHYYADKVYVVIRPASPNDKVRVLLDDNVVDQAQAGNDVKNGFVQFDMAREYNLIDLHGRRGDHVLQLEFQSSGTQVYVFTFG